jgi:predicted nuclease of restriction endonuclease-like (RecB) superfamily
MGNPTSAASKLKPSVPLYDDIREVVLSARQTIARGDLLQVHTNYEIGHRIFEQEQQGADRSEYAEIIRELAARLTAEFGNGFSKSNLEYLRRYYLAYLERGLQKIAQTVSGILTHGTLIPNQPAFTLSWQHYVLLITLNEAERSFYEIEAAQQGWTLREMKRQFNAGLYERLALNRNKQSIRELATIGQHVAQPCDLLKDPYVLEFLGLEEKSRCSASDLESAIVSHIANFLPELGKCFLFEARQKRFTFDEEHFLVDLVLYNRLLRSYVLIDLKLGKLTHQDLVKTDAENHPIGVVLCKKKNSATVEITLPKDANIHEREYQLSCPVKRSCRRSLRNGPVSKMNKKGKYASAHSNDRIHPVS